MYQDQFLHIWFHEYHLNLNSLIMDIQVEEVVERLQLPAESWFHLIQQHLPGWASLSLSTPGQLWCAVKSRTAGTWREPDRFMSAGNRGGMPNGLKQDIVTTGDFKNFLKSQLRGAVMGPLGLGVLKSNQLNNWSNSFAHCMLPSAALPPFLWKLLMSLVCSFVSLCFHICPQASWLSTENQIC